jgi:hypothetical protein
MEEKQRSSTQQALFYGMITGVILIVYSLILYIANLYTNRALGYVALLLLVAGMVYGTLEYRKTYGNGFLTYGKAFSLCFMIALFTSILTAIYTYFFAEFIFPGLSQEILEKAREEMMNSGREVTEEQIEIGLEWTRKFTTPVMMAILDLVTKVFFGVILSLLAALFLKKEDKSLNTTT